MTFRPSLFCKKKKKKSKSEHLNLSVDIKYPMVETMMSLLTLE